MYQSAAVKKYFCAFVVLSCAIIYAYAGGKYELHLIEYDNYEGLDERGESCEGRHAHLPCEFYLKINVKIGSYDKTFVTRHTSGNIIKFGHVLSDTMTNPIVKEVKNLTEYLNFTINVYDFDDVGREDGKDDHIETFKFQLPRKLDFEWREKLLKGKPYKNTVLHGRNTSQLHLKYRTRCNEHYYLSDCTRYCFPQDSRDGHYTCYADGAKSCNKGWKNPEKNCVEMDRSVDEGSNAHWKTRDAVIGVIVVLVIGGIFLGLYLGCRKRSWKEILPCVTQPSPEENGGANGDSPDASKTPLMAVAESGGSRRADAQGNATVAESEFGSCQRMEKPNPYTKHESYTGIENSIVSVPDKTQTSCGDAGACSSRMADAEQEQKRTQLGSEGGTNGGDGDAACASGPDQPGAAVEEATEIRFSEPAAGGEQGHSRSI